MKQALLLIALLSVLAGCREDVDDSFPDNIAGCDSSMPVGPDHDLNIPFYVSLPPLVPADNPMKINSIVLGRHLFWDKRLSGDNTISCGTCHSPDEGFSDSDQFSVGIDGIVGVRQSMSLSNLVFQENITWDGHQPDLEAQSVAPVINEIEMHEDWDNAIMELEADPMYATMFEEAYGSPCIDRDRATKSMAQFLRSMTSFNAKYDRVVYGPEEFTALEAIGFSIWNLEGGTGTGQEGADCFHCHSLETQIFTDSEFRNNGLDSVFTDLGRGGFTGIPGQNGQFKTPSLRNIELTAPYMHDGRFETLEEVIDHYNSGGTPSATIDPNMEFLGGGLELTEERKQGLVAFLKTFTDEGFINNPAFSDPF